MSPTASSGHSVDDGAALLPGARWESGAPPPTGEGQGGRREESGEGVEDSTAVPQHKRASRGAPRRFKCGYPECDKVYSRAEHLQRHQLNHSPKEIYQCDVSGCDLRFVRADLLARHKKRHCTSYVPRNRVACFKTPESVPITTGVAKPPSQSPSPASPRSSARPSQQQPPPPVKEQPPPQATGSDYSSQGLPPQQPSSSSSTSSAPRPAGQTAPQADGQPHSQGRYDIAMRLTPESNPTSTPAVLPDLSPNPMTRPNPTSWSQPIDQSNVGRLERPKSPTVTGYSFYDERSGREGPGPMTGAVPMMPFNGAPVDADDGMIRERFAAWLFDPQMSFSDVNLPFMEGGLESTFNSNIQYDYEYFSAQTQLPDPIAPIQTDMADVIISESRHQDILRWFQIFRVKQPKYEHLITRLIHKSDLPAISPDMLQACLHEYWDVISPRVPVIHQPTFSVNGCSVLLLMVMAALGAASLRSKDMTGSFVDYGAFSDIIIECVRWEIVMADDASPPVALWVAQALLLLEYYEKLYSSRRLHERAHIYHSVTLTLLRRGSPLIGRTGSESPPEENPGAEEHPGTGNLRYSNGSPALDSRMWWVRWAETESMHRVVFVAFMLDITHAAMFGHSADMAAHEIRLPLPCDDNLWTAPSPEVCRELDANLRMYGIRQVSFLDGLKNALHGKEVNTHSFARMIIMSGLLSVGWHLSHRESHLRWLEPGAPSGDGDYDKGDWRKVLLKAFDNWKESFSRANGDNETGSRIASNGPIRSASVLYHLAHISLHVDIVDCQVYAGAKRLLGRRVSSRDQSNAAQRMSVWATHPSTRHAVLHAFRLLYLVLVDPQTKRRRPGFESEPAASMRYSIWNEVDLHRPWIMYYAALSIWSFDRALGSNEGRVPLQASESESEAASYGKLVDYLARISDLRDLSETTAASLQEGLPDLLDVLQGILSPAHSDLLQEAHERLRVCKGLLSSSSVLA